ncbi:hypothetical protein [Micromonospora sp. C81]|uniref:hypothetical protein n=1 Tax=Micromonospora sp. C81 TaxID=2824881 RepID=UPI001B379753|nr:hypothetical protein [Micromonospora sp. C81]MBQ1036308.1 hypothetical protein [Micromonospora sp. C81]
MAKTHRVSPEEPSRAADRLTDELEAVDQELWDAFSHASMSWGAGYGKRRITRRMSSGAWVSLLAALCLTTFSTGVPLTLIDPTRELGIALVAGSIFACAAFLGQVWTVQYQRESTLKNQLFGAEQQQQLHDLLKERDRLIGQLNRLTEQDEGLSD